MDALTDYCFPLNGNKEEPSIVGIENVMTAYKETLPEIQSHGLTLFAPVLKHFKDYVA